MSRDSSLRRRVDSKSCPYPNMLDLKRPLNSWSAQNFGKDRPDGGLDSPVSRTSVDRKRLLVFCTGPLLYRLQPIIDRLEQDMNVEVTVLTEAALSEDRDIETPACDAALVLWSQFFTPLTNRLSALSERLSKAGKLLLNDVPKLIKMQDRSWLLRELKERGIPCPHFIECIRDHGHEPVVEEHDDHIVVAGERINKPFVEKPVDRRDRDIYVYFTKEAGGGRALLSTRESGDVEYCCRFDPVGRVRRQGSFVYQEYFQSEGFMVQVVCVGRIAYGNAMLSGLFSQKQVSAVSRVGTESQAVPGGSAASSSGAATVEPSRSYSSPCAVLLRQEEKQIAQSLSLILGQTLFGITFARSQTANGPATSYVIDVWPGIPRSGVGTHADDVVKALMEDLNKRMVVTSEGTIMRRSKSMQDINSSGTDDRNEIHIDLDHLENESSPTATTAPASNASDRDQQEEPQRFGVPRTFSQGPCDESIADRLCVLLVARHAERTPKQKVKTKVNMESEFAAGWLTGWLAGASAEAGTAVAPPPTVELRSPDQLTRIGKAAKKFLEDGQKVGTLSDALRCVASTGQQCHAKVTRDKAKLTLALKWGGELTPSGQEDAENFGTGFRQEAYAGEDIHELHATLRHDIKVYSSREPRCQQTAAAFCRGFFHLQSPLPPIIAALVRKDEFGRLEPGTGYGPSDRPPEHPVQLGAADQELRDSGQYTWSELEEIVRGLVVAPALMDNYTTLGEALKDLWHRIQRVITALDEDMPSLYQGETAALLRARYEDALSDFGTPDRLNFDKVAHLLDHVEYDMRHNSKSLPQAAAAALADALPLCQQVCDVLVPLEAKMESANTTGALSERAAPLLNKLRWDLRVASGAQLGADDKSEHMQKHQDLYKTKSAGMRGTSQGDCVRTRLYFTHNSHLQGLLAGMLGGVQGVKEPQMVPRLGFLSHIIVQLWKNRADGRLNVTCHYARQGSEERFHIFSMPLESVDGWWSTLLEERRRRGSSGA